MGTLPLQLHLERQLHPKIDAPPRVRLEPDPPAKVLAPLPDVEEPKGVGPHPQAFHGPRVEANAVVAVAHNKLAALRPHVYADPMRAAVLHRVDQELTHRLEDRDPHDLVGLLTRVIGVNVDGKAVLALELIPEPLDRRYKPQFVQHRRADLDRKAARRADRLIEQRPHLLEVCSYPEKAMLRWISTTFILRVVSACPIWSWRSDAIVRRSASSASESSAAKERSRSR